jgi:hypothetical protein
VARNTREKSSSTRISAQLTYRALKVVIRQRIRSSIGYKTPDEIEKQSRAS